MQPFQRKKKEIGDTYDFDIITLRLASPERIRDWSYGEVTKPETINYRTQRSEKNGLFDEKIFGPEKDFECFCGKYKGIRYKGIVCDRCGVELTRSIVRRERMGHIELSSPVTHIWFLRSIPSRIATLLDLSAGDVEKVVYFAGYIIRKVAEEERERILREIDTEYKTKVKSAADDKQKEKLKELLTTAKKEIDLIHPGKIIDEAQYHKFSVRYGTMFEAGIGTESLLEVVKNIDLQKLRDDLVALRDKATAPERPKVTKRLALVSSLIAAKVRPEWMFMTVLPVIPPALRPMVALEGGRHASSDVNDLYRRVINRNNRLKKLIDIRAPEVILRNEKRILQEAVDALLDNSIRHSGTTLSAMNQAQRRPLKSLSDYLKGKQGYFRQNLLGKRVDYSGRSVIVVGPELALDQCGLPKHMALELFRPFVIAKLLERELAFNIRGAGRLIEEGDPVVWAILEEVIDGKHVLLNRAPTLHRQGIQAFRPVLIEGNAIQVHPLVCPAFNADFDGDQMAVHVPLSKEAQLEAAEIISADKNILKPGNGAPVVATTLDIALGCYWMTKSEEGAKGEGKIFPSPNSAISAYDFGVVSFRAKIRVAVKDSDKYAAYQGGLLETTVGRLLFNSILPSDHPYINEEMKKANLLSLVDRLIERYGLKEVPVIVDRIKAFGFKYATVSGTTWGLDDLKIPEGKQAIVEKARADQAEVWAQYQDGLLSLQERKRINIEIWHKAKTDVEALIPATLKEHGSVSDLLLSGARGSIGQITQMAGMKGLIQNTKGDTIEFPITASMKEGLSPIEYFTTTHGARKGLADTALKTARAGYLTRKLFDVAQDAIITEEDCKTKNGVGISRKSASGIEIPFVKSIRGRVLSSDIQDGNGKALYSAGHLLSTGDAEHVERNESVNEVTVRSPMTCETKRGVCRKCYGADMSTNELVDLGEAVGTIAAQAIGEPGTQLTMRTFHTGGTASVGGDITQGLPRIEEVFERRIPKNPAVVSTVDGVVSELNDTGKEKTMVVLPELGEKGTSAKQKAVEYSVHYRRMPLVKVGDAVKKGQLLTDGSADLSVLYKYAGKEATQEYIIAETSKIYELQGATISRKHIEVIIKQMFSRRRIKSPGETKLSIGDVVENWEFAAVNEEAEKESKEPATGDTLLLGIAEVAITRKSFLSAASFQNTTKVLINTALKGTVDPLRGLKENVIIGRLIPAGTAFQGSRKAGWIRDLQERERERERAVEEANIAEEMRRAAEEENPGEPKMPIIRNKFEE